jgi:hypothetical protein
VWPVVAIAAVCVEYWTAPFPIVRLEHPAIYETLRARPEEGSLLELPLGIGDGLGVRRGRFDAAYLLHQTVHGRPLVGGIIARLSPSVIAAWEADPLLRSLMDLSEAVEPGEMPDTTEALERLDEMGIRFVMLNRATSPPGLVDYARSVLPLTQIAEEGQRTLYLVNR